MSRRIERVNSLLRQEISELVRRGVKDPRLAQLVTITRVAVTPDLTLARVYVSVLGSEEERDSTLAALTSAAPYIRRQLRPRLTIKRLPELSFRRDEAMERSSRVLSLIERVRREWDEPHE
ncbi:MAG: 30S ribosome-binding factor RbfA [Dehalococcoidia bacterium]